MLNPEQFTQIGIPTILSISSQPVRLPGSASAIASQITNSGLVALEVASQPNEPPYAIVPAGGTLCIPIAESTYLHSEGATSAVVQMLKSNSSDPLRGFVHNLEGLQNFRQSVGKLISGGIDLLVVGDSIFEGYDVTTAKNRFSNILAHQLRVRLDPLAEFPYGEVMHTAVQSSSDYPGVNPLGGLNTAAPFAYFDNAANWTSRASQASAFNGRYAFTSTAGAKMRWEIPAPCNLTDMEYLYGVVYSYGSGKLDIYQNVTGFQSGNGTVLSQTLNLNGPGTSFTGRIHQSGLNPAESLVVQLTQISGIMPAENLALYGGNFMSGVRVSNLAASSTATDFWSGPYPLEWAGKELASVLDPDVSTGGVHRCKLWITNLITNDLILNTNSSSTNPYLSRSAYQANLTTMFQSVSELPSSPSIIHVIPPASSFAVGFDLLDYWGQYRDAAIEAASGFANVVVMDLFGWTGDAPRSGLCTQLGWPYNDHHYLDSFNQYLATNIARILF